jgi:hypothetical protein
VKPTESLVQYYYQKNTDFGGFIGKEGVIFFDKNLQGPYKHVLSKLGYSELVQRLLEKMTFSLLDPLLAEIGRDGTGSDLDKAIKSGTSP